MERLDYFWCLEFWPYIAQVFVYTVNLSARKHFQILDTQSYQPPNFLKDKKIDKNKNTSHLNVHVYMFTTS